MTKPRPHFWYCFTCNEKVPSWQGQPAKGWHETSGCDVSDALVMRAPKKARKNDR